MPEGKHFEVAESLRKKFGGSKVEEKKKKGMPAASFTTENGLKVSVVNARKGELPFSSQIFIESEIHDEEGGHATIKLRKGDTEEDSSFIVSANNTYPGLIPMSHITPHLFEVISAAKGHLKQLD